MDYSNNRVVIELQDVKREFLVGEEVVHALRGVSFKIHEGELWELPVRENPHF